MKIARTKFLDLLKKVLPASNKKAQLPILGCVLMRVEPGRITMEATDLGIRAVAWEEEKVDEKWSVAIHANFVQRLLSMIDEPQIVLKPEYDKDKQISRLAVHYGRAGVIRLSVMDAADFPAHPQVDWQPVLTVSGTWLRDLDQKIAVASDDKGFSTYQSIFERVHLIRDGSYAISGARMALDRTMAVPGDGFHVLAQSLRRAALMLADEEVIRIESHGVNEAQRVRLVGDNVIVEMDSEPMNLPEHVSKLVETVSTVGSKVIIERDAIMRYLKMATVRGATGLVPICFDARGGGAPLAIYLSGSELDRSSDPVLAGVETDAEFFIAMDIEIFRSIVKTIDDPFVEIHYFGDRVPVRIGGSEHPERFQVVAPMVAVQRRDVKLPVAA